jgi:hypothetical protein
VQQAVNQIPDSNFRIALGSADKTEQRDKSVVWPRHLMAGLLSLLLAGERRGRRPALPRCNSVVSLSRLLESLTA